MAMDLIKRVAKGMAVDDAEEMAIAFNITGSAIDRAMKGRESSRRKRRQQRRAQRH